MAAFAKVEGTEDGSFTAADILALAAEIKRRKVSRTAKVQVLMHLSGSKLEMRVPLKNVRRVVLPPVEVPERKTPMRGAKRKQH